MSGSSTDASVFCSVVAFGRNAATNPFTLAPNDAASSAGPIGAVERVILLREEHFADERIAESLHLIVGARRRERRRRGALLSLQPHAAASDERADDGATATQPSRARGRSIEST